MPKSDLILLAMNNDQILQLFEKALQASSYRVLIARDRGSLEKNLQINSPVALILAENFSEIPGVEICISIKEKFPVLPILLFAARESNQLLRNALRAGISDCLIPPVLPGEILEIVEAAVNRSFVLRDWSTKEVKRNTDKLNRKLEEFQKLEAILNHIEDGVIILDYQESIILVNSAARQIFDIKEQSLEGKNIFKVFKFEDLNKLISMQRENPRCNSEIHFDDDRVYSAQCAPIPEIGTSVIMQNITHMKHIVRLNNEFVSMVSHDLRSPLTAITGYVDLLERVGPVNEKQKDFIHRVQMSVGTVTALINDLLELGRIEAGFSGTVDSIQLDQVLEEAIESQKLQFEQKEIDLVRSIPGGIPPIFGNPLRMRQLVDNLLGNALKYSPEKGRIQVSIDIESGQLILQISDDGPGIPASDQSHIFDKFFRGSNIPTSVEGSGLGLSIVQSIVDMHHGRIWVDSSDGKGATFTIVLPIIKSQ